MQFLSNPTSIHVTARLPCHVANQTTSWSKEGEFQVFGSPFEPVFYLHYQSETTITWQLPRENLPPPTVSQAVQYHTMKAMD